ncbi:hypothetical protein [Romboutsia sp.]|uniref:hypothetical protein n=1 Tax=Romboutsia sp. TaxID=1965302 RepID=UPI003F34BA15
MQNIFKASEKLFFSILIICLLSFLYFTTIPINEGTLLVGIIFSILYFGVNFYVGYRYNLNILEALIVGMIGCSIGIFFSFFALYAQVILERPHFAIWLTIPYFIPTMSLTKLIPMEITIDYSFCLMAINIILVIFGSISKNIMNKLSLQFK